MKRTFTQKVKQVPSCAADSFETLLKFSLKHSVGAALPPDVNRRARTSAAMIGLAISMGASGLLLPQQGDEAMAVEPVALEPTITSGSTESSISITAAPSAESDVAPVSTSSQPAEAAQTANTTSAQPTVVKHEVQEGETLWDLAQTYEVKPEAIAASNRIPPSAVLPVGQKLKIPAVNGIVHEVKPGETVESLSKSYGVEPTQLIASASVSESSQLQPGESVTVPGNVNHLLKAKQDVALNSLKEQQNRLNDSLAELRSEESTNLSKLGAVPGSASTEASNSVTLPPAVLQQDKSVVNTPQPMVTVPTSPVTIPVPTPEIAATPTTSRSEVTGKLPSPVVIPVPTPEIATTPNQNKPEAIGKLPSPVVIPMPTPEVATSPTVKPDAATPAPSPLAIPVPTPSIAASPTEKPEANGQLPTPVAIPVPTPEVAASPIGKPESVTIPNLRIDPVPSTENPAKPQAPRPVVIETLVATRAENLYRVRPGDTLDAIARRHGLSRSELIQANALNNPNLIRVNQPLRIPQTQSSVAADSTVTVLPGISSTSSNARSRQERVGVVIPTPAVPTQSQPIPTRVLAQSTSTEDSAPNSVVVSAQASQSEDSQSNPYVDRLRAEIEKMREEYRQQRNNPQANNAPINIAVPAVSTPAIPSTNTAAVPIRINPEFNPRAYNESQEAQLSRRQQPQVRSGSIPIEVPPPEAPALSQRNLVASAPAPAQNYNPMIRTPVGTTVAPELPSLSPADQYLPNSPAQFNGYIWPTKGVLTSGYGMRWGRMHKGIDIAAPVGTPIVAAAPGIVVSAGWNSGGYGNLVELQHPDGSLTLYAHNNRILVRRGQEVAQGQQISEMGSTGRSTGPHLHFEVHPNGRGAVNPIAYLPGRTR
ncbi:MAG TPA: peptidoglycan DD-metalloendopeptidase family protein [Coleofasciculaceae cyanobacterium]